MYSRTKFRQKILHTQNNVCHVNFCICALQLHTLLSKASFLEKHIKVSFKNIYANFKEYAPAQETSKN